MLFIHFFTSSFFGFTDAQPPANFCTTKLTLKIRAKEQREKKGKVEKGKVEKGKEKRKNGKSWPVDIQHCGRNSVIGNGCWPWIIFVYFKPSSNTG